MKKAFTLIEILIASTIFAVIMLIVTSTFSWASLYNVRISESRDTSLNARKISEMISKDLRMANGSISVKSSATKSDEVGEFSIYTCQNPNNCSLNEDIITTQDLDDLDKNDNYRNALLILQKDQQKAIFYREVKDEFFLTRQEINLPETTSEININQEFKYKSTDLSQVINSKNIDVIAKFAGYTPTAKSDKRKAQPFVKMKLIFQTDNYDTQPPMYRSKMEINTSVTSRSYNLDR